MAGNAFTFGVKPGGLTDRSQVSILLCYLIRTAAPLCRQDIENALLGEQLVNYFELAGSLADLEDQGLVTVDENGGYHITPKGISVTDELGFDLLPRSVRETAIRAVIRAQQWVRKAAQHQTQVTKTDQGYVVHCSINELGSEVFGLSFTLPDPLTAEMVKNALIEKGSEIYALLLETMTTDSTRQEEPDSTAKG